MTYQISKGNFLVGIRTSTITVPSSTTTVNNGSILLNAFHTTEREYSTSPKITGVAYSDSRTDSTYGTSPIMSTSPTSSGGFGSDIPENLGSKPCGTSLGGGFYSDETIYLHYYNYDKDRILSDTYVVCFGELS
jgi:hypothetical protein